MISFPVVILKFFTIQIRGMVKLLQDNELTKGQIRKLNALRKSLGEKIADEAFAKWLKNQPLKSTLDKPDAVAVKIEKALSKHLNDKEFNLGRRGYVIKRSKGRGATGFVVSKIE